MTTIRRVRTLPPLVVLAVLRCGTAPATASVLPTGRSRNRMFAFLTAGVCVVAITGCGSSGHKSSASSRGSSQLAFSQCMRRNGVPNFPDPSSGGGININQGSGVNPASPAFQAAQATCYKLVPGAAPPAHPTEQQKLYLVSISQCMRSHDVTGFPDPTTSTTQPIINFQNYSLVVGIGDLWFLLPSTISINSPAFRQAAKTCNFRWL